MCFFSKNKYLLSAFSNRTYMFVYLFYYYYVFFQSSLGNSYLMFTATGNQKSHPDITAMSNGEN